MDKFALVTGGGGGIGKASALELAEAGWHVAVTGRRPDPLQATAREIEAKGRRALAQAVRRRRSRSVCAPCSHAVEAAFGRLDLLFNNAGSRRARRPDGGADLRAVEDGRRRQSDRRRSCARRARFG